MTGFRVALRRSFLEALRQMTDLAQDQAGAIIQSLENHGSFDGDPQEYILLQPDNRYKLYTCEHVRDWGWKLVWYYENENSIIVQAEQSSQKRLTPNRSLKAT